MAATQVSGRPEGRPAMDTGSAGARGASSNGQRQGGGPRQERAGPREETRSP